MPAFYQSRKRVIQLIFSAAFLLIAAQLFNLQILSNQYAKLADENAIFRKVIYPSRGIIFDRNKKPLLENTSMYDLMFTPNQIGKNFDTATICRILEIDTTEFKNRVVTAIIKNTRSRPSIFESLLTPIQVARINENLYRLQPAFYLQERPVRIYPYKVGAHILGYVREVDSATLIKSNFFYSLGDFAGKSGLENYYEKILLGERGVQYILKDKFGVLQGSYQNNTFDTTAIAGRSLYTYIDVEVQALAEKLLTNKIGSVVAIEPSTGGIIAMATGPNYDPNLLTGSESRKNFNSLFNDPGLPMNNRGMQGVYPPGSTFKPIDALIALDEGVITPSFGYPCFGNYGPCGRPKCTHNGGGHAANLRLAIANSCNAYFADIFRKIIDNRNYKNEAEGLTKWKEYLSALGLGHRLGIDLPSESPGYIPDTNRFNNPRVFGKGKWNSCSIVSLGIGQGEIQATPLQMANAMCIIANRGYYYIPHFVKEIEKETASDTILNKFRKKIIPVHISDTIFQSVVDGMEAVTQIGTARNAVIEGISVCAKTGTAENYAVENGKRVKQKDHSFFVAFAPKQNPKIAVCVVVENAGFGSTWAGPIASLIMEKYLKDSIAGPHRKAEVERIANAYLIPSFVKRKIALRDSLKQIRLKKEMNKEKENTKLGLQMGIKNFLFTNEPNTNNVFASLEINNFLNVASIHSIVVYSVLSQNNFVWRTFEDFFRYKERIIAILKRKKIFLMSNINQA